MRPTHSEEARVAASSPHRAAPAFRGYRAAPAFRGYLLSASAQMSTLPFLPALVRPPPPPTSSFLLSHPTTLATSSSSMPLPMPPLRQPADHPLYPSRPRSSSSILPDGQFRQFGPGVLRAGFLQKSPPNISLRRMAEESRLQRRWCARLVGPLVSAAAVMLHLPCWLVSRCGGAGASQSLGAV